MMEGKELKRRIRRTRRVRGEKGEEFDIERDRTSRVRIKRVLQKE